MTKDRKLDHIELALSAPSLQQENFGMYYEPMLAAHPTVADAKFSFLDIQFQAPLWISSMTGGTQKAKTINQNLAKACAEFGLGMGLGSCRTLLDSDLRLEDFAIRKYMPGRPLWANLGIAQLEQLVLDQQLEKIDRLFELLETDGLIIHINPVQEWLQPEGDCLTKSPLWTLEKYLSKSKYPIMVKEVGQGMGPESLKVLMQLPIKAIDLGAFGGTNFAQIEAMRGQSKEGKLDRSYLQGIGHTAQEMIVWLNELSASSQSAPEVIVSGGIKNPLQAYALRSKLKQNSVVGLAGSVLPHSLGDYQQLQSYLETFISDYFFAASYFRSSPS